MPMELKDKDTAGSDDEEDLEKLRLAALQTLKKPAAVVNTFKKSPPGIKRRNYGRNRNGQFRIKNTNLISIPTIDNTIVNDEIKLVLPQDRYCNPKKDVDEKAESTSKFDRYDNSDRSESESDYESESGSESGSPAKLERASSLEALMQELENEIQGNTQPKSERVENKKKIKKRKKKEVTTKEIVPIENKTIEIKEKNECQTIEDKTIDTPSLSPKSDFIRKKSPLNPRMRRNFSKFDRKTRNISYQAQYNVPPLNYSIPLPFNNPVLYNPVQYTPTPIIPPQIPPHPMETHRMYYDRPLSPLSLNTDDALTIARAPLSPRSAAFVLQNRDAIERRKKSPRRSYSRSPSPRYHRSKSKERTPKFTKSRSRTPLRDERRLTPVKEVRKRSPVRRRSAERRSPENNGKKKMVRERLGTKKKRSRSPSPVPVAKILKVDDEKLDPILEARKKKFETNEIKNKEGIIRLKPKMDETKPENENKMSKVSEEKVVVEHVPEIIDELDENIDDILNAKVDDIFSDEETDEENEGRFKNSAEKDKKRNVGVLPFTKLLDTNKSVKPDLLGGEKNSRRERLRSPLRLRETKNYNTESKSENQKIRSTNDGNKNDMKDRLMVRRPRPERKEKLAPPIENKKIEIKIRNPAKYETTSKYDVANKNEVKERNVEKTSRKVEVSAKKSDDEIDSLEAKIVLDAEEDETLFNQKSDSGDLRAQLSRKRAERQNRLPIAENVPSRLLQNALQGAVFKKQKKVKVENEAAPKDGKMPIHLRLGIANAEAVQEPKIKKPSKSKGRTDQV